MAQFNLEDYETVASRITKLYERCADARIITKNLTTEADRARGTWVVEAEIWLPSWTLPKEASGWIETQHRTGWFLKASGLAFEVDGVGMANKTSALENCETSAIGRALANMGLSGDQRASREEMAKVQRGTQPARDFLAEAQTIMNRDDLRKLYNEARVANIGQHILSQITDYGKTLEKLEKGE
jgi:hypothetical protein